MADLISRPSRAGLSRYLPVLAWLPRYNRNNLTGDLLAGLVVAVMLVPQGMAYALLAGMPPEAGLYASIVPLLLYGLMGTSPALSVGPVAIISLMVASGIGQLQPQSTAEYVLLASTLALMVGIIQLIMGVLRAGFLVNFLSHPVLSGFMNAAAVIIAISQLRHLLGITVPGGDNAFVTLANTIQRLNQTNLVTLALGLAAIGVLFYFQSGLKTHLKQLNVPPVWITPISKAGPLVIVLGGIVIAASLSLDDRAGVRVIGAVPAGLPPLTLPSFDAGWWQALIPAAVAISLVGFMESVSVAKSLAGKRREKIDANQELIALGTANLGAAFTGTYPVAGGIARSAVNYAAGASTGMASIITAVLMAITVLLLTPLFYYLPQSVLAAIIMVAVFNLLDVPAFRQTWRYSKVDALSMMVTFVAVLIVGVEIGILLGTGAAIALFLWRTSRPHVAVIGRVGNTEHYRNVLRHEVHTYPHIIAVRVDESLYFPNAQYLEDVVLNLIADNPEAEHLVLLCSAINFIDSSALDVLETLIDTLDEAGVRLYLAEVKGPVMDSLHRVGFAQRLGEGRVFLSIHQAVETLAAATPAPVLAEELAP